MNPLTQLFWPMNLGALFIPNWANHGGEWVTGFVQTIPNWANLWVVGRILMADVFFEASRLLRNTRLL